MRLLLSLLITLSLSGQTMMRVQRRAAASVISNCSGAPSLTGTSGCIARETFEGSALCFADYGNYCDAGFEWVSGGANFNGTTSPLQGSRSLLLPASTGTVIRGLTATGTVYGAIMFQFDAAASGDRTVQLELRTSGNSTLCRGYIWQGNSLGALVGGGEDNSAAISLSANTTYYLKVRYVPGTGANATCTAYLSTNGTSWGYSANAANGSVTADAGRIVPVGGPTNLKYDDLRVSATDINYW